MCVHFKLEMIKKNSKLNNNKIEILGTIPE